MPDPVDPGRGQSSRVPDEAAGTRLDVFVAGLMGWSRSRAAAAIAAGAVQLDGRAATKATRLTGGEWLEVLAPVPAEVHPVIALPPVRHEDEHLLVVAKPAGLVVHPGVGRPSGTLVDALLAADVTLAPAGGVLRPGIVHRLDRDTSGLLVVAKTDVAHRGLVDALRRRVVRRRYLALVEGAPPPRGRIDAPIGRDPRRRTRFVAAADGKPAVTHFETQDVGAAPNGGPVTLLVCSLETGRTHQIRVHLRFAGHPIVGDGTYGADVGLAHSLGIDRPFLHAAHLAFAHPVTGEDIAVDEPLPEELRAVATAANVAVP